MKLKTLQIDSYVIHEKYLNINYCWHSSGVFKQSQLLQKQNFIHTNWEIETLSAAKILINRCCAYPRVSCALSLGPCICFALNTTVVVQKTSPFLFPLIILPQKLTNVPIIQWEVIGTQIRVVTACNSVSQGFSSPTKVHVQLACNGFAKW